jgi:hypothetical protein
MTTEITGRTWYQRPEESKGKFTPVRRKLDGEFDRGALVDFYRIFCLDGHRCILEVTNFSDGFRVAASGPNAEEIEIQVNGTKHRGGKGRFIGEGHEVEARVSGKGYLRISWTANPERRRG